MQVPNTHGEVCPADGEPEIRTIFSCTGNFSERRRRELVRGFGGMRYHHQYT